MFLTLGPVLLSASLAVTWDRIAKVGGIIGLFILVITGAVFGTIKAGESYCARYDFALCPSMREGFVTGIRSLACDETPVPLMKFSSEELPATAGLCLTGVSVIMGVPREMIRKPGSV